MADRTAPAADCEDEPASCQVLLGGHGGGRGFKSPSALKAENRWMEGVSPRKQLLEHGACVLRPHFLGQRGKVLETTWNCLKVSRGLTWEKIQFILCNFGGSDVGPVNTG